MFRGEYLCMTLHEYLQGMKGKTAAVIGLGVSNRPLVELLARERCEASSPATGRSARGARRRGGALRGARRGAAPRRGLSARSGRGRRLPHARDAARRAGATGGEGARRGHHERDGGVLRRLSVSHSRRDRQRRQDHHRERHCRASQGRGTARGSAATSAVRCSRTRSR